VTTIMNPRTEIEQPTEAEFDSAAHKRYANDLIRSSCAGWAKADPLPFFCECGSPACLQTVWLTRREYDDCHSGPRTRVVVTGHEAEGRLAPAGVA
jgi:hypothetical protein